MIPNIKIDPIEIAKAFMESITSNEKDLGIVIKFAADCSKDENCYESLKTFLKAVIIGIARTRQKKEVELLIAELENKVRFYGKAPENKVGEGEAEETARR